MKMLFKLIIVLLIQIVVFSIAVFFDKKHRDQYPRLFLLTLWWTIGYWVISLLNE